MTDKILDVGSGDGCITSEIVNRGYNVRAIDVVDKGKCFIPETFDGKTIPFNDKEFDVGIVSFVLHHVDDQIDMLRELRRVCKRVLILEDIPGKNWLDKFLISEHSRSDWGGGNVGNFHSLHEWEQIFADIGLRTVHVEKVNRLYYPFSDRPWFYPINRAFMVLDADSS